MGRRRPRRLRETAFASLFLLITPGVGCSPAPGSTESDPMAEETIPGSTLAPGAWALLSRPDCGGAYPDRLTLLEDGTYRGEREPPGGFTLWDVGSWRVTSPGRVEISTANDAIVAYRFEVDGDVVTFHDPADCRFRYRRSG